MRKVLLAGVASIVTVGLVGGFLLTRPQSKVIGLEPYEVASASAEQLEEVSRLRVFFGHQSVGDNMLDVLPDVFADAGVEAPDIIESEDAVSGSGPIVLHTHIGVNGDPLAKIAEFDRIIRGGMGDAVDVAVFKFCYIDLVDGTDVDEVFDAYRETMAALERDYPDVTFIYVTVPLTVDFSGKVDLAKRRVKSILGRDDEYGPEHNVVREEFNALLRAEYSDSGQLFDIAAVQSTDADGIRRTRSHDGDTFFAMAQFLASDPGHLNRDGSRVVASAFVDAIANATT